jgi:hypothetical protein
MIMRGSLIREPSFSYPSVCAKNMTLVIRLYGNALARELHPASLVKLNIYTVYLSVKTYGMSVRAWAFTFLILYNGLVREPGWFSNKSPKNVDFLIKSTFFKRKLFGN